MSLESDSEELYISEAVYEPLMIFVGEGSGEDLKVGNEEKKKIFFFGQPGCLKHSPLRVNPNDTINNHSKPAETESTGITNDKSSPENNKNSNQSQNNSGSDDEDGDDLIRKISMALEDKTLKSLPVTPEKKTASPIRTIPDSPDQKASTSISNENEVVNLSSDFSKSEVEDDSQIENNVKAEDVNKSDESEETDSKAEVIVEIKKIEENDQKENIETIESSSEHVQSSDNNECLEKSTTIKSIVPYDDDSTSSSQLDIAKEPLVEEQTTNNEEVVAEKPEADESASLEINERAEILEFKTTDNISETAAEEVEEQQSETVGSPLEALKTDDEEILPINEKQQVTEKFIESVDVNEAAVFCEDAQTDSSVVESPFEAAKSTDDEKLPLNDKHQVTEKFIESFDVNKTEVSKEDAQIDSSVVAIQKDDDVVEDKSPEKSEEISAALVVNSSIVDEPEISISEVEDNSKDDLNEEVPSDEETINESMTSEQPMMRSIDIDTPKDTENHNEAEETSDQPTVESDVDEQVADEPEVDDQQSIAPKMEIDTPEFQDVSLSSTDTVKCKIDVEVSVEQIESIVPVTEVTESSEMTVDSDDESPSQEIDKNENIEHNLSATQTIAEDLINIEKSLPDEEIAHDGQPVEEIPDAAVENLKIDSEEDIDDLPAQTHEPDVEKNENTLENIEDEIKREDESCKSESLNESFGNKSSRNDDNGQEQQTVLKEKEETLLGDLPSDNNKIQLNPLERENENLVSDCAPQFEEIPSVEVRSSDIVTAAVTQTTTAHKEEASIELTSNERTSEVKPTETSPLELTVNDTKLTELTAIEADETKTEVETTETVSTEVISTDDETPNEENPIKHIEEEISVEEIDDEIDNVSSQAEAFIEPECQVPETTEVTKLEQRLTEEIRKPIEIEQRVPVEEEEARTEDESNEMESIEANEELNCVAETIEPEPEPEEIISIEAKEEVEPIGEKSDIVETVQDQEQPDKAVPQLESTIKPDLEDTENISSPEDFNDYQDDHVSDHDSKDSDEEQQLQINHDSEPDEDIQPLNEVRKETVPAIEEPTMNEVESLADEVSPPNDDNLRERIQTPVPLILEPSETVEDLSPVRTNRLAEPENKVAVVTEETQPATKDIENNCDAEKALKENSIVEESQEFSKPIVTRKRKMSERKSVSESDSESNNVSETVSHENTSEDEEAVLKKKPRMRGKTTTPRKLQPVRRSAVAKKDNVNEKVEEVTQPQAAVADEAESKQTLQNLQFDYDGTDDIAANVAAIRTMICKEPKKETTSERSDDEDSEKNKFGNKRSRKTKRGRVSKRNEAESSSDEDSVKKSSKFDSKRSKTADDQSSTPKKKRETGPKGMLKYIDTSLVIETTENEAPVRQSRRIAQQKIREETERRQMEEKLLKQMKMDAEKKKKGGSDDEVEIEEPKESSGDDESFKESRRKKKSKIKPSDKQWQTSSSHSEHSESEQDYLEHVPSDPGSPLFKSDHEFSPESDVDDTTQVQPLKRARTAKKLEPVSSSDEDENINPQHACQVCHKTDSPEWILLCDGCDCGYHCSCLKPMIFLIPSGNWYCPLCCHKKLVDNLTDQLSQLDTLIHNIETAEIRRQRQKQAEISEQNILQERRKMRAAENERERRQSASENKDSNGSSDSDNSSDVPLTDYFYKLRKRNQTAAPSYRFNEYDDLINSAIRHDMDDVKSAGNLGRGKDISNIVDADDEEKQPQGEENVSDSEKLPKADKKEDAESSGSEIVRPKKSAKRKKKSRKLNNLDVSSEDERGSDEDFKGTSSSDSEVDEEDLSMSSVSESSLDLPSKKSKGRNIRSSTRNRAKRYDQRFINDGDTDSDDEPLVRAKRSKKKDSDEEEFDLNDDEDDEGSLAEEIDSEDLCDDTETDSSSENNWPKRKKKRVASYDHKQRKAPKKNDNEDKAFRAGISKKKVLKKSDKESEGSGSETEKGRRKTRGKKLLYLIEDDLDSDESDGIKPGVKRPDTPPEEREMFVKKQEEIKRMLAAKDTEAARKLAAPTIQPINIPMESPISPSIPFSNEPASLSTIPKNVIESAKALDTDYNRIKPIALGSQARGNDGSLQPNDMNEEELAKMMEEEDFAQHQLKLAGEAIARSKKLLELEAKEEEFAAFSKVNREKEWLPAPGPVSIPIEAKKRSRKSKSSEKSNEEFTGFPKAQVAPKHLTPPTMPPLLGPNSVQQQPKHPMQMQPQPSLMANLMQQQQPPFVSAPPNMTNDRPSVLSSFMTRPELLPQQHPKIHQPIPPDAYMKNQPLPTQPFDESDDKKKGRRKKFTPLRTDLVEGNISKLAKLDPPSVIQSTMNQNTERLDDKHKVPRPDHPKFAVAAPPQIFNPATNPTPSVITRLLQPQQRPGLGTGPYPQGFTEVGQPVGENPNVRMYPEELKNSTPSKARGPLQQPQLGNALPQSSFGENPFVPRNIHNLYRGPPPYGIPPHARLPPYAFHHLHPNLRPGDYSAPYNIPPQFSYYAPPAHSRQPPQSSAIPLTPHGPTQLVAGTEDISNSIRNANNSDEPSETSEFGGLVSYFSSQQELD